MNRFMKRRRGLIVIVTLLALVGCNGGAWSSGDRVLVAKCLQETDLQPPRRFDVVVFKFPEGPLENGSPKNYIKRLLGLPGQILAIFFGQLFSWEGQPGEPSPYEEDLRNPNINPLDLWKKEYMHINDEKSQSLFEQGDFKILRKPLDVMMALRRIVYDNDFQAVDLAAAPELRRWRPEQSSAWKADKDFRAFHCAGGKADAIDWLRYRHVPPGPERAGLAGHEVKPQLITDFEAYNNFTLQARGIQGPAQNWVGDLMLECKLTVDKAEGSFHMELSRGINRYRARFDLETGLCTLERQGPAEQKADAWKELATKPSGVRGPGSYELRFANFDARLTVWAKDKLPFGDGYDFHPPEMRARGEDPRDAEKRRGPTLNDLEPASLGSKGAAVTVQNVRLWRNTYYTLGPEAGGLHQPEDFVNPEAWDSIRKLSYKTMYVQPGHYLCLGDNSPASSDSREWGVVPARLMLGRALLVYFPFHRAGVIR
jgi:signal peptidase I